MPFALENKITLYDYGIDLITIKDKTKTGIQAKRLWR